MTDIDFDSARRLDQGPKPHRREQWIEDEPTLSFEYNLIGARSRVVGLVGTSVASGVVLTWVFSDLLSRTIGALTYYLDKGTLDGSAIGQMIGEAVQGLFFTFCLSLVLIGLGKSIGINLAMLRQSEPPLPQNPREGINTGAKRCVLTEDSYLEERRHVKSETHLRLMAPAHAHGDIVVMTWPNLRASVLRAKGGEEDAREWAKSLRAARRRTAPDGWPLPAETPRDAIAHNLTRKEADKLFSDFNAAQGLPKDSPVAVTIVYIVNVVFFLGLVFLAFSNETPAEKVLYAVAALGLLAGLIVDLRINLPRFRSRRDGLARVNGAVPGATCGPALTWISRDGLTEHRRFQRSFISWDGIDYVEERADKFMFIAGMSIEMITPIDSAIVARLHDAGFSPEGGPWTPRKEGRKWLRPHK